MFAFGETVTVLRGTPVIDPYSGEETGTDWSNPTPTPFPDCGVAPRLTPETPASDRTMIVEGCTVYMPYGTDILATDRAMVRGDTYEVDGDVGVWRNPFTGWEPGIEVNLKKVNG